jgi:hypothetical protein
MEPICERVSVGDGVVDTWFISGVDPKPIGIGFALDVEPSFVESEFMPEYEAAFGFERAEDSMDDQPVPELSNRDKALLQLALVDILLICQIVET